MLGVITAPHDPQHFFNFVVLCGSGKYFCLAVICICGVALSDEGKETLDIVRPFIETGMCFTLAKYALDNIKTQDVNSMNLVLCLLTIDRKYNPYVGPET